jgi:hypothetical protein
MLVSWESGGNLVGLWRSAPGMPFLRDRTSLIERSATTASPLCHVCPSHNPAVNPLSRSSPLCVIARPTGPRASRSHGGLT